jgi:hypothetical protein
MMKVLMKLGREGMYFNIIKAIYNKTTVKEKTETIFPKVKNEANVPTLSTPIQQSWNSKTEKKTGRRNKMNTKR